MLVMVVVRVVRILVKRHARAVIVMCLVKAAIVARDAMRVTHVKGANRARPAIRVLHATKTVMKPATKDATEGKSMTQNTKPFQESRIPPLTEKRTKELIMDTLIELGLISETSKKEADIK